MTVAERTIAGVAVSVIVAGAGFLALHGRAGGLSAAVGTAAPAQAAVAQVSKPAARQPAARRAPVPPGGAVAAQHADPLTGAVAGYVAGRHGTVLAAVYDVKTGQTWQLGGGTAQDEASVVKLDVLETLLSQRNGGLPDAADQALARSMIEDSDNNAATSLWDEAGGAPGIGSYNGQAGLTRTTPSPCVTCAGFPWPGWGLTTTMPADQLTLLKQLVVPGDHPLLTAAQRSYALSLMENVTADQAWGVSGGVPSGVTVALKNGWLPLDNADTDWQVNSVGWVSGQGRDYLAAVFTTGDAGEQYGIDTINGLSSLIWSAMR